LNSSAKSVIRVSLGHDVAQSGRSTGPSEKWSKRVRPNMYIEEIDPSAFLELISLETLWLDHNLHIDFDGSLLRNSLGLEFVNLSYNRMVHLPPMPSELLSRLKTLFLYGSPFEYKDIEAFRQRVWKQFPKLSLHL